MSENLNPTERKTLLELARSAIGRRLGLESPPVDLPASPQLALSSGAFVTLHKKGHLRGCIGRFTSTGPITETVQEMAEAAAFEDPRFPPLNQREMADIDLEISVLTPMRQVTDVHEIEVGKHGIYIIRGMNRGVLLPQVATEQHWDRETFLDNTCLKAGLPANAWQDPKTEIYVFSAEVFGEKDQV